ncbi:MAG: hypothetical protein IKR49_05435 [Clostridia bacterium]|nr:hypothetical protein [Clostridia bacterium]
MKMFKRIGALALALALIVTLFAACGKPSVEKQIIGSWRDSAGVIGFDFAEEGVGKLIALDFTVPVLNISLKGEYDMTYTLSTDDNDVTTLHISFNYVIPINLDLTVEIDNDIMRLSHESGLSYTMTRVTETDAAPAENASEPLSE